jgi:hypothetical protein
MANDMDRDGEALLRYLVPLAQERLTDPEAEEVAPFAAVIRADGEARPFVGEPASPAPPDPEAQFSALRDALREVLAGDVAIRAAGIAALVHLVREDIDLHSDAIRFFLETREGEALNVFQPYTLDEGGQFEEGDGFAVEAEPLLFSGTD